MILPSLDDWAPEWAAVVGGEVLVARDALSRRVSGWQFEGWLSRMSWPIYVTQRGRAMLEATATEDLATRAAEALDAETAEIARDDDPAAIPGGPATDD